MKEHEFIYVHVDPSEPSEAVNEYHRRPYASPCSIMMHNGFSSNEARRARKQRYRLRQTTSHSSLLVARQGDVSRKLNQAFLLVDSFNINFVDEERSDICSCVFVMNGFFRGVVCVYKGIKS